MAVAVGTIIANRPPHRSVRALLRIRLPPRMTGVEALHRIRMENASDWNPALHEPEEAALLCGRFLLGLLGLGVDLSVLTVHG